MALSQRDIDLFLDETVQDNFKILPDIFRQLNKEKEKLSNQLSGQEETGEKEEKDSWQTVSRDTRRTISELQLLKQKCINLQNELNKKEEKEEQKKDEELQIQIFLPLLKDLNDMERLRKYLLWLDKGHQLSSKIVFKLKGGSTVTKDMMEEAVVSFTQLSTLTSKLSSSQCRHLKEYFTSTCEQRRIELKDKLSWELNEILKTINWPLTKESSIKALKNWSQKQSIFDANLKHLLTLDTTSKSNEKIPNIDDSLILPIELLLIPLRKRFKFHFCGDRQTNSKDKPEWFFTQVSTWITDHTHFIESHVQPVLSADPSYQHIDAKVEFIRGLLQEIVNKLKYELSLNNLILDDDYLMSHLIDELLLFERELHSVHSYPSLYPSCILILMDEGPLCRWLNLERQFAVEKLKVLMESPTSWSLLYTKVLAADDTRVPECAERMMQLVAGITERFKHLPSLYVRLQFLELQSDLLLEFHQDLTDNVTRVASLPLSSRFFSYLNAAHYIASLLNKWGEETFYLELHYYAKQLSTDTLKKKEINDIIHQIELLRKLDPDYAQLEGTAFENVISAFNSLCHDMKSKLLEFVSKNVKSAITGYKRERWHNYPTLHDINDLEVSPSFVTFLTKLQEILHHINSSVTPDLLDAIFDEICNLIDDIIFQQVIYGNNFNDGGCVQIHHDITRTLIPILSQHMSRAPSTISVLLKSCDAVNLLNQDTTVLQVVLSLLKLAQNGDQEAEQEMNATLKAWHVCSLNTNEIASILESRIIT